jgi:formylglycine-generating enzyme required for sulfatase activity
MTHVAVNVADALCPGQAPEGLVPEVGWRAAHLAGEALLETGLKEVHARERHVQVLARVQTRLVDLLQQNALPPSERVGAGDTLASLGDPRPGVGLRPDGIPDMVWCEVPAGSFLMGTEEEAVPALMERYGGNREWYEWEMPQHELTLPPFYVARYPVTVAQFQAFVKDGGYAIQRHWTQAGWDWRERNDRAGPDRYPRPFDLPNHPVVGVSWYEAMAFGRWLAEKWQSASNRVPVWRDGNLETVNLEAGVFQVRLPTEAEWEKAAHGTGGREFAWGDEFDLDRCNVVESGIGATSAVGAFPRGEGSCGAMDVCGTVWEWCQSLYKEYPYEAEDGREDVEASGRRVLRGGSWDLGQASARCVCRNLNHPVDRSNYIGFRLVLAPADLPGSLPGG